MNILVVATHHGAFLTLQQLKQWNVGGDVVVVIPQSQIDKYSGFSGEVFTKYESNIKRFCGRKFKAYASEDWDPTKKLQSARATLATLDKKGKWLVLEAGSLLGGAHAKPLPDCPTFGVTYSRVHPKMKKLYRMLGQPEESKLISLNSFIVNMDDASGRVGILDSNLFHRSDLLYAQSFGMLWCIRYQQMMKDAITVSFWMEAIRGKQEDGEWVAYPYDWYLGYAEKVRKLLPESTYKNIVENGLMTEELAELVALDL